MPAQRRSRERERGSCLAVFFASSCSRHSSMGVRPSSVTSDGMLPAGAYKQQTLVKLGAVCLSHISKPAKPATHHCMHSAVTDSCDCNPCHMQSKCCQDRWPEETLARARKLPCTHLCLNCQALIAAVALFEAFLLLTCQPTRKSRNKKRASSCWWACQQ